MNSNRPAVPDDKLLRKSVAERLLSRASELDASSSAVADLRAAAVEAGISESAFNAALAEMQADDAAPVPAVAPPPRWRFRLGFVTAAVAAILAVGAMAVVRKPASVSSVFRTIEESIPLRCLSPAQAAELIRTSGSLSRTTVVISPDQASRVITVRAPGPEMQIVHSLLDQRESPAACAVTPPPPPAGR